MVDVTLVSFDRGTKTEVNFRYVKDHPSCVTSKVMKIPPEMGFDKMNSSVRPVCTHACNELI
jgi:hypothetical protein